MAWHRLLICFALALSVSACNNVGLGPEPSRGALVADRIAQVFKGAAWFSSLQLVDGKPKVDVYSAGKSNGVDVPGGDADVYMVADAPQALATEACSAIAGVVNDPARGPTLSLTRVRVVVGSTWQTDWCYPPQSP
jgi:hypothetical protein